MRSVIIADECQTKEEKRLLFAVFRLRVLDEMGHTERWAQVKHKMALIVVQAILDRRAA